MIGRTLSHYRILEKIGEGGMGEVYLARDTRLERDVAVKILPPGRLENEEARSLFRREALTLSKLNHPNIQTVHDFDSDGGVDFLVTEYVPGTTLSDLLGDGGPALDVVRKLGEQLAAALQAAHECGVVHRDLKPSNIRVLPDGRLKVLDFGLAKLVQNRSGVASSLSELETQTFAGTPHYMAPEQRLGHPADARTDLYAAGLVLKEMLGGKVPLSLAHVIGRLLESDPAKRYQTATELGEALRNAAKRTLSIPWKLAVPGMAALAVVAGFVLLRPAPESSAIDSVVALPSEVHGPSAEEFLAEAFPNTISTYLAQVEGLETKLSPTQLDIERFRGDLDRVARTYGVKGLVLSTVTATPEGFLLNVKLVDSSTRRIVWSSEYPGERSEYFSIVPRAAEGLARQLGSSMGATPAVHQVDAELAYQNGLFYANRYNNLHHMEDFDRALSSFEKTLELEPTFADAAALVGALYEFRLEAGLPPNEAIPQMHSWADKALEIDPENGRAWTNLTLLELGRGNADASVTLSGLRAVRYAPRFTGAHVALSFVLSSCFLSLQATREAARLDPLYLYPR